MTGRVNQVHVINLTVIGLIIHAHGACFNGDAAFALQVHIIEQLFFHFALCDRFALLQQAVGQG